MDESEDFNLMLDVSLSDVEEDKSKGPVDDTSPLNETPFVFKAADKLGPTSEQGVSSGAGDRSAKHDERLGLVGANDERRERDETAIAEEEDDHHMLSTFNAEDASGGSDKPQGAGEEGKQKESESHSAFLSDHPMLSGGAGDRSAKHDETQCLVGAQNDETAIAEEEDDHPMLSTFNAEDASGGSDKPQGAGEESKQEDSESVRHVEADNGALYGEGSVKTVSAGKEDARAATDADALHFWVATSNEDALAPTDRTVKTVSAGEEEKQRDDESHNASHNASDETVSADDETLGVNEEDENSVSNTLVRKRKAEADGGELPRKVLVIASSSGTARPVASSSGSSRRDPFSRPELGMSRHNVIPKVFSASDTIFQQNLKKCSDGMSFIYKAEHLLKDNGIVGPEKLSMMKLEQFLLDLARISTTAGLHYHICIDGGNGSTMTRYFEHGCYTGFMEAFKPFVENDRITPVPYRVYTTSDVLQRKTDKIAKREKKDRTGKAPYNEKKEDPRSYLSWVKKVKEHWKDLLNIISASPLRIHSAVVRVQRVNPSEKNKKHQYFYVVGHEKKNVEEFFKIVRLHGNQETYEVEDVEKAFDARWLKDQVNFIGSVTNYHFDDPSNHATQRFLSVSLQGERVPLSIRNKLIHYHEQNRVADVEKEIDAFLSGVAVQKRRKLKYKPRKARPAQQQDAVHIPDEIGDVESMAQPGADTPFEQFTHSMLQSGKFIWRSHSSEMDTFLMNDYDTDSRQIRPLSFEHVQVDYYTDGAIFYCSCQAFNQANTEGLVDSNITGSCMHCDFIKEYVFPKYVEITSGSCDEGRIHRFVQSAFDENRPDVLRISEEGSKTVKYSVKPEVGYDRRIHFVHITEKEFISCQCGLCHVAMRQVARHRTRSLISLDKFDNLCPHLQMMKRHADQWLSCIAEETDENEEATPNEGPVRKASIDENGLWQFPSLSTHAPSDPKSQDAKTHNLKRMLLFSTSSRRNRHGHVLDYDVCAPYRSTCECGAGFRNVAKPDGINLSSQFGNKTTTLYTRHGPVQMTAHRWRCKNFTCEVRYTGAQDGIFFKSTQTAFCDEVLQDFEDELFDTTNGTNFSTYVERMDSIYQSNGCTPRQFCSKNTFTDAMFGWWANKKIDFREYIDPYCRYDPKVLACDGTHVGPALRTVRMTPIEKPESNHNQLVKVKRYKRTFITGATKEAKWARKHLKYLSQKATNRLDENKRLDPNDEKEQNRILIERCPASMKPLILGVSTLSMEREMLRATGAVFRLLHTDAALVAIIPYRHLADVKELLGQHIGHHTPNYRRLCSFIGSDFPRLITTSLETEWENAAKDLVSHLCSEVERIHADKEESAEEDTPDRVGCKPYDPASGVAYYFSREGHQVRTTPNYTMGKEPTKKAKGKEPKKKAKDTEENPQCTKKYPKVSRGGYTNTFLFMCPVHGHCYGFHIIPGSEGRKDPFSALFKYKEEPPQHLFYDFACSFSEYALNREPDYFKKCRTWHDLFHSFNHVCGEIFKSSRMPNLTANTEICEQFNSYLQRLKWTCTHLGQERFCFILQYAIFKWNVKQTERIEKRNDQVKKASASIAP